MVKSVLLSAAIALAPLAAQTDILRPDRLKLYECAVEINGQPASGADYTLSLGRSQATITAGERKVFDGMSSNSYDRAHQTRVYYSYPGQPGSETLSVPDSFFRAGRGRVYHNFKIGGQPTFRVYRCESFGAKG